MMAKEREERYPDVYELDRDLYRLQIGEPPEAEEPSTTGIETAIDPAAGARRAGPTVSELPPPRPAAGHHTPSPRPRAYAPEAAPHDRTPAPAADAPTRVVPVPASFREEDLRFIETQLARRIGPVARVLVKKAVKSASSLVALGTALAEHIPDDAEKREFRYAVRQRAR
jgi:hypothetical protein